MPKLQAMTSARAGRAAGGTGTGAGAAAHACRAPRTPPRRRPRGLERPEVVIKKPHFLCSSFFFFRGVGEAGIIWKSDSVWEMITSVGGRARIGLHSVV